MINPLGQTPRTAHTTIVASRRSKRRNRRESVPTVDRAKLDALARPAETTSSGEESRTWLRRPLRRLLNQSIFPRQTTSSPLSSAINPSEVALLDMQQLLAIAGLTWKAAFRFRLFWVLAVLLLGSVVVLPLLLKDDQTARGFIQLLLTYNLTVITTLLGFSTFGSPVARSRATSRNARCRWWL